MPYIKRERRAVLDSLPWAADTPGELNYAITQVVMNYLEGKHLDYSAFNEVMGVLECAKQELYRRMVVPYEDKKIAENGDVYGVFST